MNKIYIILASLFLISCDESSFNLHKKQSLICDGVILLHKNEVCKGQSIQFTVSITSNNIYISRDTCTYKIAEKLEKKLENENKIDFEIKFQDNNTKHEMMQDFTINKINGEFGMGETDLSVLSMDNISIGGFCKKTKNIIE